MKGSISKVRSSCQQVRKPISEVSDSKPKSSAPRNVSKLLTLSSAVCRQCFFCELVQFTLSNILFDLAVSNLSVKLKKPSTESGKFRRRQTLNFLFNTFDLTHGNLPIPNFSRVSKRRLTTGIPAAIEPHLGDFHRLRRNYTISPRTPNDAVPFGHRILRGLSQGSPVISSYRGCRYTRSDPVP